ncbi:hypothetical protein [Flexibacterium corallicola]|uniref:hypothetical protein n=1 Tax=Flexibacterium corallicola TaxID=3037259 RepID=UPI00286ED6A6|nr:hypothetical protein [Pseudovibrio sp. M1P-2-3]
MITLSKLVADEGGKPTGIPEGIVAIGSSKKVHAIWGLQLNCNDNLSTLNHYISSSPYNIKEVSISIELNDGSLCEDWLDVVIYLVSTGINVIVEINPHQLLQVRDFSSLLDDLEHLDVSVSLFPSYKSNLKEREDFYNDLEILTLRYMQHTHSTRQIYPIGSFLRGIVQEHLTGNLHPPLARGPKYVTHRMRFFLSEADEQRILERIKPILVGGAGNLRSTINLSLNALHRDIKEKLNNTKSKKNLNNLLKKQVKYKLKEEYRKDA